MRMSLKDLFITFMHLADAFIQSGLQCILAIRVLSVCQYVCSLGIEPTIFCTTNAMLYHWTTGTLDFKKGCVMWNMAHFEMIQHNWFQIFVQDSPLNIKRICASYTPVLVLLNLSEVLPVFANLSSQSLKWSWISTRPYLRFNCDFQRTSGTVLSKHRINNRAKWAYATIQKFVTFYARLHLFYHSLQKYYKTIHFLHNLFENAFRCIIR